MIAAMLIVVAVMLVLDGQAVQAGIAMLLALASANSQTVRRRPPRRPWYRGG